MRRALLAVLALTAAVAFGVGASAFDDAVAEAGGPVLSDDGDDLPPPGEGGSGSPANRPDLSGAAGGCLLCGLSARSLVAGLLPSTDPLALLSVAAVVVTLGAVAGLRSTDTADPVDLERSRDRNSVADAADDNASDPPPQAPPTNDVYRAWLTMTERVQVTTPETATPGEYARRAVAAGLDREPVDQLTRTFRAVRYGNADATPARERAASEALDALGGEGEA